MRYHIQPPYTADNLPDEPELLTIIDELKRNETDIRDLITRAQHDCASIGQRHTVRPGFERADFCGSMEKMYRLLSCALEEAKLRRVSAEAWYHWRRDLRHFPSCPKTFADWQEWAEAEEKKGLAVFGLEF